MSAAASVPPPPPLTTVVAVFVGLAAIAANLDLAIADFAFLLPKMGEHKLLSLLLLMTFSGK